jgi:hypothetical protein
MTSKGNIFHKKHLSNTRQLDGFIDEAAVPSPHDYGFEENEVWESAHLLQSDV